MLIESHCLGSRTGGNQVQGLLGLHKRPYLKNEQKILSSLVWFENEPFLFCFRLPQDGALRGHWQCRSDSKGVGVPLIESHLVLPPFPLDAL